MRISSLVTEVRETLGRLANAGLLSLWIAGKPVSSSRPRVTKRGWAYHSPPYQQWMKGAWKHVEALETAPTDRPVAALIEVICPRPKKTDHSAPIGDVDNYAKGPLDLLTKSQKAWLDDRQIVFLTVIKRWADDGEEVGFKLWWCEIEGE